MSFALGPAVGVIDGDVPDDQRAFYRARAGAEDRQAEIDATRSFGFGSARPR